MSNTSAEVKNRYNAKAYDNITLAVPKGEKDEWKQLAEAEGLSLTAFVRKKVNGEIRPSKPVTE